MKHIGSSEPTIRVSHFPILGEIDVKLLSEVKRNDLDNIIQLSLELDDKEYNDFGLYFTEIEYLHIKTNILKIINKYSPISSTMTQEEYEDIMKKIKEGVKPMDKVKAQLSNSIYEFYNIGIAELSDVQILIYTYLMKDFKNR